MEEIKCTNCGMVVTEGADACPNCGTPVVKNEVLETAIVAVQEPTEVTSDKQTKKGKINVKFLIGFVLGAVMVFMGIFVISKQADTTTYEVNKYNSSPYSIIAYSFGGDFYTEIYGSNCTIIDELNDINGNLADGLTDMNEIAAITTSSIGSAVNAIYFSVGMLIIALGVGTIAITFATSKKE